MNDLLQKRVVVSELATATGSGGPVVFTSTGDKFIMSPANPLKILRWGIVWAVAKDASALVVTLAQRPTAGSDTARAVIDTLSDSAARAAGVQVERKFSGTNPNSSTGSDGSLVNIAAGGLPIIYPGQQAVIAVTTGASSTGQGYLYAEYIEYPAVPEMVSNQGTTLTYTVVQV